MGVDKPDFGIKIIQTFDASGKPAYETKGGDLLFFTTPASATTLQLINR